MSDDRQPTARMPERPSLLAKATGTISRKQVQHEAARALGVREDDVDHKLVDALIAQNNKAAARMAYLVGGVLLFAAVVIALVVGGTFAFSGFGLDVGVGDAPKAAE